MLELTFSRFPVLVVDDEEDNLDAFRFAFRKSFRLTYAQGGEQALSLLDELDPAVIVTDQRMPGMSGIELLRRAIARRPDAVGVLLTAYTDLPVLLEAINSGAVYRYVQKPWDSKELSVVLRQAIERFHTLRENQRLRDRLAGYAAYLEREHRDPLELGHLVAKSPPMRAALEQLERLAAERGPVLLVGEPGTEKELFARAIHLGSACHGGPFVRVSCSELPGERLERELFARRASPPSDERAERAPNDGRAERATSDRRAERAGRVELAEGGTLFVDDVDAAGPAAQRGLLEVLEREAELAKAEGGAHRGAGAVRLVLGTTRAAWRAALDPALVARLEERTIAIPPLRERADDLSELCERLVERHAERHGCGRVVPSPAALARFGGYPWPGNVRELSVVLERAVLLARSRAHAIDAAASSALAPGDPPAQGLAGPEGAASPGPDAGISLVDVADGLVQPEADRVDLPAQLDEIERRELHAALARCQGNKAEVARMLGIQRTTLYYRLKKLGIES